MFIMVCTILIATLILSNVNSSSKPNEVVINIYDINNGTIIKAYNVNNYLGLHQRVSASELFIGWINVPFSSISIFNLSDTSVNKIEGVFDGLSIHNDRMLVKTVYEELYLYNITTNESSLLLNRDIYVIHSFQLNRYYALLECEYQSPYDNYLIISINLSNGIITEIGIGEYASINGYDVIYHSDHIQASQYYDKTVYLHNLSSNSTTTVETDAVVITNQDEYYAWESENKTIFTRNKSSGKIKVLENVKGLHGRISSVDNNNVVYHSSGENNLADLFLLDLASEKTIRLTKTGDYQERNSAICNNYIIWVQLGYVNDNIPNISIQYSTLSFFIAIFIIRNRDFYQIHL